MCDGIGGRIARQIAGGAAPLLKAHVHSLLTNLPELPQVLRTIEVSKALERLDSDKKHEADNYRFVTFDEGGGVQLARLPKVDETRAHVAGAIGRTLELLSA